ncbi:MAG: type II toxin-antitoxin system VapC family toxin [Candidatus Daviesbacteria bacterium]|nr:type II toxin-antitoxin system VapC family toxin [Candidatus Daviesbacteria bacterium]
MAGNVKTKLVIDASFALAFILPDEYNPEVNNYFNQFKAVTIQFISSPLLMFEVTNGLLLALKRNHVNKKYCEERLEELSNYKIEIEKIDFTETFSLAQKHNLTCYDASYLYLAQSQNLPLLTLDKHLIPFSSSLIKTVN